MFLFFAAILSLNKLPEFTIDELVAKEFSGSCQYVYHREKASLDEILVDLEEKNKGSKWPMKAVKDDYVFYKGAKLVDGKLVKHKYLVFSTKKGTHEVFGCFW